MTHKTSHSSPSAKPQKTKDSPVNASPGDPGDAGFRTAIGELEGIRDELRVRAHLAGMEIKDAWDDLDTRYLALRDLAEGARDEAVTKARKGLVEIRKELHALRARIDDEDTSDNEGDAPKPS